MENKSHALMAGLFTIALTVALALTVYWFSRDRTQRDPYDLYTLHSVSGLTTQAAVRFRGLEVGRVQKVGFDPANPGEILIRIGVIRGTPITKTTHAEMASQGITGLAYIQLDDDGKPGAPLVTSEDEVARIEIRPGLLDKLSARSEHIVDQLDEALKNLNQMLGPKNRDALAHTLANLDTTTGQLAELGPKLDPALKQLPGLMSETHQTVASFRHVAQDLNRMTTRLQEKNGVLENLTLSLDQLNQTVNAVTTSTLPRVDALTDDARRSARSVTQVANMINDNPQSLLLGPRRGEPGPGEAGFGTPRVEDETPAEKAANIITGKH